MAIIDPVPMEKIDQPEVREMIEQARELGVPDDQFLGILAHVEGYTEPLFDALYRSHALGDVDHKLKEIIRVQLARLAKDPYFSAMRSSKAQAEGLTEEDIEAGCGDFENESRFSDAEKWALRYAWLMFREPKKLNQAFYDEGKTHYSEAQIMEIGAFVAYHYGMQVFMSTLQMTPDD